MTKKTKNGIMIFEKKQAPTYCTGERGIHLKKQLLGDAKPEFREKPPKASDGAEIGGREYTIAEELPSYFCDR